MQFYSKDKLIFLFEIAKFMTFSMCETTYKGPNPNKVINPPAVISTQKINKESYENSISNRCLTTSIVHSNRRLKNASEIYNTNYNSANDDSDIGISFNTLNFNHIRINSKNEQKIATNQSDTDSSSSSYSENKYRVVTRKLIERNRRKLKRKALELSGDKYKQSVYVNPLPKLETLVHAINDQKE